MWHVPRAARATGCAQESHRLGAHDSGVRLRRSRTDVRRIERFVRHVRVRVRPRWDRQQHRDLDADPGDVSARLCRHCCHRDLRCARGADHLLCLRLYLGCDRGIDLSAHRPLGLGRTARRRAGLARVPWIPRLRRCERRARHRRDGRDCWCADDRAPRRPLRRRRIDATVQGISASAECVGGDDPVDWLVGVQRREPA